jgi:hypothetical protein
MRRYITDTALVFSVLIAIAGVLELLFGETHSLIPLAVAFGLFAFSYMVKRY